MNKKFYLQLTRIVLAITLTAGIIGSIIFMLLHDVIKDMPFSDF